MYNRIKLPKMGGANVVYKETETDILHRKKLIENYNNAMSFSETVESGMYVPSVCGDDNYSVDSIGHRLFPFNVDNLVKSFDDVMSGTQIIFREAVHLVENKTEQEKNAKKFSQMYNDFCEFYDTFNTLHEKCNYYIQQTTAVFRCYDDTSNAPSQDDPRWLVMRNDGIGASEAENLVKRESKTLTLWMKEKAGVIPRSFTGNWYTEWGHQMEPVVGKILDHKYNTKLLESTSLAHKKYPFIRASLDRYGFVYGMPYIIEIKSPVTRVPIKDTIPAGYDLQMYQQHEVSEIQNGIFADFMFKSHNTHKELIDAIKNDTVTKPSRKKYYGAILKFPCSKRAFAYSPIAHPEKCKEWVKEMEKKINAKGYVIDESSKKWNASEEYNGIVKVEYWRLIHMVLVPHKYNPNWCDQNLEKYKEMWRRIQEYKHGVKDEGDILDDIDKDFFD